MDPSPLTSPLGDLEPQLAGAVYQLTGVVDDLDQLSPRSRRLASFLDGQRTVVQLCTEAKVSLTSGLCLVDRLAELGIIAPAPANREDAGFTSLEEAFFASEVQPIDECDEPFPSLGDRMSAAFSRAFCRLTESLQGA
jgi:hypothetical protein